MPGRQEMRIEPAMQGGRQHGFGRNTASILALELLFRASGFIILAVMSRTLGADQIGSYFFVVSLSEAFGMVAGLSLGPVLMRRLAIDPDGAARHFAGYFGLRLLSVLPYFACVLGAASFFPEVPTGLVLAVALFVMLQNAFQTLATAFVALGRRRRPIVISAVVQTLFLILFCGAMSLSPSLDVVVETHTLRALALVGLALAALRHIARPLRVRWDPELLREAVPFVALSALGTVRRRSDTIFLGALANFSDVGHYTLAARVLEAAVFVPLAFGQGLLPQLAQQGLTSQNRKAFFRGLAIVVGLGAAGALFLWVIAAPLARLLYGPLAASVVVIIRLLAPLVPLLFTQLYLDQVMNALHRERQSLLATAIASVVLVAFFFALIPTFGPFGTALARIIASALQLVLVAIFLGAAFRTARRSSGPAGPQG
jgi:O-antigen/teichoic acid export membrane protein